MTDITLSLLIVVLILATNLHIYLNRRRTLMALDFTKINADADTQTAAVAAHLAADAADQAKLDAVSAKIEANTAALTAAPAAPAPAPAQTT